MTWTVLLGRWVEFARNALALPESGQGQLLRESVADIIMLQAVWFALQHLSELSNDQRALGIDRAALLIPKHTQAIHRRWAEQTMPPTLVDLIEDVRQQLVRVDAKP